jgi:hypothetical protein
MAKNEPDFQALSISLRGVVEEVLRSTVNLSFSREPEFSERAVIEYDSRMRASGMEKFNAPCYVSAVSYYRDEARLKSSDACGVVVIYVEEELAGRLLLASGYKTVNEEDEDAALDQCGELCNMIAGNFRKELSALGFGDLKTGAPVNHKNSIPSGVEFPYSQYKLGQTEFYVLKQKALVVDLCVEPPG